MPLPRFIQPMAARLVAKLPKGPDWQYEVKFDGYRALLLTAGDRVELGSWSKRQTWPLAEGPVVSWLLKGARPVTRSASRHQPCTRPDRPEVE